MSLYIVPVVNEKLQSFGTEGSGQGQFCCPIGVAVDGEGNTLDLVT